MRDYYLKYRLFTIIFSITLFSCSDDEPDYSGRTSYFKNIINGVESSDSLKLMTYNIHLGFRNANPWDKDQVGGSEGHIDSLADFLMSYGADIIALQEVPYKRSNVLTKDFLEQLALKMEMNYAFGSNGYNDAYGIEPVKGEWGNAILSKYPIINIENVEVEYESVWERRSMLIAGLLVGDNDTLYAASTHHLPSEYGRSATASGIANYDCTVLMGDFNYTGEIIEFTQEGFLDVDSSYTYHGVDRIFYSVAYFEVLSIGTLYDSVGFSDHRPNTATLLKLY